MRTNQENLLNKKKTEKKKKKKRKKPEEPVGSSKDLRFIKSKFRKRGDRM